MFKVLRRNFSLFTSQPELLDSYPYKFLQKDRAIPFLQENKLNSAKSWTKYLIDLEDSKDE